MSWNYRILAEVVGDHTDYYIAEAYYDSEGRPRNWTDRDFNPTAGWDDLEDLRGTIRQVQEAMEKARFARHGQRT